MGWTHLGVRLHPRPGDASTFAPCGLKLLIRDHLEETQPVIADLPHDFGSGPSIDGQSAFKLRLTNRLAGGRQVHHPRAGSEEHEVPLSHRHEARKSLHQGQSWRDCPVLGVQRDERVELFAHENKQRTIPLGSPAAKGWVYVPGCRLDLQRQISNCVNGNIFRDLTRDTTCGIFMTQ
jgi:hypothetical protein